MAEQRVVVVGAVVGGLAAALDLAARGLAVTLLERAAVPGGKLRLLHPAGRPVDAGPTVFTLRPVFEELFADAGARLADHLTLHPAAILARHAWRDGSRLDLFADPRHSEDAIGRFAGRAAAAGFRAFRARAHGMWRTLEHSFVRARRPTPLTLVARAGLRGAGDLWRIAPFATLWTELGDYFADTRMRQLFGRYATYAGSSPFLAPATLMLIADVEQQGVWLVEGGMHRIAEALAGLAAARGATLRFGAEVAAIELAGGRVAAVRLAGGERIPAEAVVFNGDAAALSAGLLGAAVARAVPPMPATERSLSAVTFALAARADGFPLSRHNVFFSEDYIAEFADLRAGRLPAQPTVYICAQDRDAADGAAPDMAERLLALVNAPPNGDAQEFTPAEIARCRTTMLAQLRHCGITLRTEAELTTTPAGFARLYPATGGALYGAAVHGAMASFRRPGARTKLPGLYLAGGSTHPGAGVPMAALSGRLAAASLIADLASTTRSRPAAMRGGISTR